MDYTTAREIAQTLITNGWRRNDVQVKQVDNIPYNTKFAVTFKKNGKTITISEVK